MRLLTSREASKILSVHANTLRAWEKEGKIKAVRTKSNQRRYNLEELFDKNKNKKKICYCRVSSSKQRDDLERQVTFMKEKYPGYEIVTDIGSGLNFKRKGLLRILEQVLKGKVEELLCAHRDRLSRFGFELIKWLIEENGGRVLVLTEDKSTASEKLTQDLMSIVHVFSCRLHGMRKYSKKKSKDKILSK